MYCTFSSGHKDRRRSNETSELASNTTRTLFEIHDAIEHSQLNSIAYALELSYEVAELYSRFIRMLIVVKIFM